MAQKKIYLIRHGKAVMEGTDIERALDEDGKIQAISLCKKIKEQFKDKKIKIFSSPFIRAMQTVEGLSQEMNVQIEHTASLEEIKMGKDPQLSKHEIIEKMWADDKFKTEKLKLLATTIGSIAPDFSWIENGKEFQLSTLNEAKNYVLVFWSTGCSHCLKEIPELHKFLQGEKNIKVIAFAMEGNDLDWGKIKITLPNWHHVLGLNKWNNKTARIYNINTTPTYFVLDSYKKIIANPVPLKDLKTILKQL